MCALASAYVCVAVCLPASLSVCLSVCLPVCPPVFLSECAWRGARLLHNLILLYTWMILVSNCMLLV